MTKNTDLKDHTDEKNLAATGHAPVSKPIKEPGPDDVTSNKVDLDATKDVVTERLDKLSEDNSPGFEKLQEEINRNAEAEASKATANTYGTFGREDNGNTPKIAEDGSKSWHPPGVAGAVK